MLSKNRRIGRKIYPKTPPIKSARGQFVSISTFFFKGKTRFSFSVGKKIAKTAVLRNKIRRIGYRVIAEHLSKVKNDFLVRFSVHSLPNSKEHFREKLAKELVRDVENLLIKSAIIKQ